jgi:hypothetical protein
MVDLASVHAQRIDAGLREFILPVIVAFVDEDVVADLPGITSSSDLRVFDDLA